MIVPELGHGQGKKNKQTKKQKKTKTLTLKWAEPGPSANYILKSKAHNNLLARKKNKNKAHYSHGLTPNAAPLLYLLDA